MDQLSERRDRLVGGLLDEIGTQVTAPTLARAVSAVLGLDTATISVASPSGPYLAGAHGPLGEEIEELQRRLGDGPTLTALQDDGPVLALDGAGLRRWRVFGPEAAAKGITALFALPLRPRRDTSSALSLYSIGGEQFDDARIGDVLLAADLIAEALVDSSAERLADRLDQVGDERSAVHHATGILVARHDLSPAAALSSLRSQAATGDTTVAEVAARILDHGSSSNPGDW